MSNSILEQNYKIYVSVSYLGSREDKSLSTSNFNIILKVVSTYLSDMTISLESLNTVRFGPRRINTSETQRCFLFPCHSLTSDDVRHMVSHMNIDFSLDKVQWRTNPLEDWICLKKKDDIFTNILDLARVKAAENCICDLQPKRITLQITIKKEIKLPHHEFEALVDAGRAEEEAEQILEAISWANRQPASVGIRFLRETGTNLEGSNRYASLLQQPTGDSEVGAKPIPAAASAIEKLEEVIFDGDNSTEILSCAICIEKLEIECTVKALPCLHYFHKNCILNWLRTSHMCPLCRFKLPTN